MGRAGVTMPMAGRIARRLPPVALFAGVALFALGLFVLGVEATGEEPRPLEPGSLTASNGTAVLAYPTRAVIAGSMRVEVSYAYPDAPGSAYYLDCLDLAAVRRGEAPGAPLLSFTGLQEGTFVISSQTVPVPDAPVLTPDPRTGVPRACDPAVAFVWAVGGDDPSQNQPTATVDLYYGSFDAGRYWVLLAVMAAGALLALLGGLAWARTRTTSLPAAGDDPLGIMRASLDRLGEQMERTRRYLLFAGVFGVFLWYPVLVPWTWKQAKLTSDNSLFAWAVGALTLTFLVVLTALWARELHRLDRELVAWRARMAELRQRETNLMDTL